MSEEQAKYNVISPEQREDIQNRVNTLYKRTRKIHKGDALMLLEQHALSDITSLLSSEQALQKENDDHKKLLEKLACERDKALSDLEQEKQAHAITKEFFDNLNIRSKEIEDQLQEQLNQAAETSLIWSKLAKDWKEKFNKVVSAGTEAKVDLIAQEAFCKILEKKYDQTVEVLKNIRFTANKSVFSSVERAQEFRENVRLLADDFLSSLSQGTEE